MKELSKRKKINSVIVAAVAIPVIIRIVLYVYIIIKGIGSFAFGDYMSLAINFIMYVSIFKYTIDYFVKGKDVTLSGLIFKFGIARLATLLGLKTDNQTIFMITAVLVFLVPYLSCNIKTKNINIILLLTIFALSIALAYFYIATPVNNQVHALGTVLYNLDSINPVIQWGLFTVLFFTRGVIELKNIK